MNWYRLTIHEIFELLGSKPKGLSSSAADEKIIVDILKEKASVPIDEINSKSGLSSSAVAGAILNLELQSVVLSLPGKLYRLA